MDDAKNKSSFWNKGKVGALAVTLVFAASNADEVDRWSQYDANGALVIPPAGCEINPVSPDNLAKKSVEAPLAQTKSAAREFSMGSVSVDKVVVQGVEYVYSQIEHFTMPESGIEVAIHAPSGVAVDTQKFSELFHAPLSEQVDYEHPEASQLIGCLRRDIIEQRKYAGSVFHVHIAPPGHCIKGMRFQSREAINKCDATGATLPEIEVSFLGVNLINYNLMMLSTPKTDRTAGQAISQTLLHEAGHAYLTLSDVPLRLDPDEKLVKNIEQSTLDSLYPAGVPEAIKYP